MFIQSMAATGLQQRLGASQDFCNSDVRKLSVNTINMNVLLLKPRTGRPTKNMRFCLNQSTPGAHSTVCHLHTHCLHDNRLAMPGKQTQVQRKQHCRRHRTQGMQAVA
ncbi:TPA: hypothetical protein ACH3X2_013539 [Trebouxia sp. C0005]